jgi:polysaccharide biosynthesis protein PslG
MLFFTVAAINPSNDTVGFADIDRTLDEMQALGVDNVRVLIPWAGVELRPRDV